MCEYCGITDLDELATRQLELAAARVEQGWCQGKMEDGEGGVCLIGGLHAVSASVRTCKQVRTGLFVSAMHVRNMAVHQAIDFNSMPHWNDRPERTKEDVVLALKQAAELVRNGEVEGYEAL